MEGRVPPAGDASDDPPPPAPTQPLPFRSGTYVVQVPKDQIYRVPPPENASLVERYRNPNRRNSCCCSCCCLWIFIVIIVIVALIIGIGLAVIYLVVQPQSPKISVDDVLVKGLHSSPHHPHPEYHISFKSQNPNQLMGVSYERGGHVSLSFKHTQIATGKPPELNQGYEYSNIFPVALAGRNIKLPSEIQRSMKGDKKSSKVHISLYLSMKVPVTMTLGGLRTWDMNMAVSCDFRVNTLAKGTQILSQQCDTNIQL